MKSDRAIAAPPCGETPRPARILVVACRRQQIVELECLLEGEDRFLYGTSCWDEAREILFRDGIDFVVGACDHPHLDPVELLDWMQRERIGARCAFLVEDHAVDPSPWIAGHGMQPLILTRSDLARLHPVIDRCAADPRRGPRHWAVPLGQVLIRLDMVAPGALERSLERQTAGRARARSRLGEILVDEGALTPDQLSIALRLQMAGPGEPVAC